MVTRYGIVTSSTWLTARHLVPWPRASFRLTKEAYVGSFRLSSGGRTNHAFGLTLVIILAAIFHTAWGEYTLVPVNLVLGGVAGVRQ